MGRTFQFLDRTVDRVGYWSTGFVLVSGSLTWLGKQLAFLGSIGWAEAAFIGIGSASILALAGSASLALFRYYRPLSTLMTEVGPNDKPIDEAFIINVVNEAIQDNYSRLNIADLEGRIASIDDKLNSLSLALDRSPIPIMSGPEMIQKIAIWRRINTVATYVISSVRYSKAEAVRREMNSVMDMLNNDPNIAMNGMASKQIMYAFMRTETMLISLGFSNDAIKGLNENQRSIIVGDASYLNLNDEAEKAKWKSGQIKREWHLLMSKANSYIQAMSSDFPQPSDNDLLINAQEPRVS